MRAPARLKHKRPTEAAILGEEGRRPARPPHGAPALPNLPWLNVLWPNLKRADVGAAGAFGRLLHWAGIIVAGLCALLAVEFAVEGWATHLSRSLLVAALALTFGTRGLRYVLARE